MIKAKKLLITLMIIVMFMGGFGTTVFASELNESEKQASLYIEEAVKTEIEEKVVATDKAEATEKTEATDEIKAADKEETADKEKATDKHKNVKDTKSKETEETEETKETKTKETKTKETKTKETKTKDTKTKDTKKSKDAKTKNSKSDKSSKDEKKATYSKEDLRLLTCLVYTEAGNQPYDGMLGVANVVLNRMKSNIFSHVNTVKGVIYDRKWAVQFSVTIKNKKTGLSPMDKALKSYDTGKFSGGNPTAQKKAMEKAEKAAKAALEGENNIGSYLCFSNKSCERSVKKKYSKYLIIEDTIFYRAK